MIVGFALSKDYLLSFALLVLAGVANVTYLMLNQVLLQFATDDRHRGRVLSVLVMIDGLTPFASLLMGALITSFTAPPVVAGFAITAALVVLLVGASSPRLRRM
jgi:hypothetical protein